MIKFLFNKTVLFIILGILTLANLALLYSLFFSSPTVTVINNSKYYNLEYHPTQGFTDFFKVINDLKVTGLKSLNAINRLTIVVSDNTIPSKENGTPVSPIQIIIDEKSNNGNLLLNLKVDPARASLTPQQQLNGMVLVSTVSHTYSLTHSSQADSERILKINEYIKKFYQAKSNPFKLIKKENK